MKNTLGLLFVCLMIAACGRNLPGSNANIQTPSLVGRWFAGTNTENQIVCTISNRREMILHMGGKVKVYSIKELPNNKLALSYVHDHKTFRKVYSYELKGNVLTIHDFVTVPTPVAGMVSFPLVLKR